MLIAVASTRPAKVEATRRAFSLVHAQFWPEESLEFVTQSVESGVPEMPKTLKELATGARNRALNLAKVVPNASFFVGLEGGFFQLVGPPEKTVHTFLQGWVYIWNGTRGAWGASYAAPVPDALARAVYRENRELGHVIDAFSGRRHVRDNEGAFGVFTLDILTRADSFEKALLSALAPFYNPDTYRKSL